MRMTRIVAGALATGALLAGQAAQAQTAKCVDPRDLSDAVVYTMPSLVDAYRTKCASTMAGKGFLAREGDRFSARFAARADQTWPGAYRLLESFAANGTNRDIVNAFEQLPPETLRLVVAPIVIQKVAQEIKVKDCAKIDRGVELLAPLPVENVGGLIGFIVEMAGVENPSLCLADSE